MSCEANPMSSVSPAPIIEYPRNINSDYLPGGTEPVIDFMQSEKGTRLIKRVAFRYYQKRVRNNQPANPSKDYTDALWCVKYGLLQQMLYHFRNGSLNEFFQTLK